MSSESNDPELQEQIAEKINELAEMIAARINPKPPVGGSVPFTPLERFKCIDYICQGAEFVCTKFRCGAGFKVREGGPPVTL